MTAVVVEEEEEVHGKRGDGAEEVEDSLADQADLEWMVRLVDREVLWMDLLAVKEALWMDHLVVQEVLWMEVLVQWAQAGY